MYLFRKINFIINYPIIYTVIILFIDVTTLFVMDDGHSKIRLNYIYLTTHKKIVVINFNLYDGVKEHMS